MVWPKRFQTFFWGYVLKFPGNVAMGKNDLKYISSGSYFLVMRPYMVNLSILRQALIYIVHQTRLTFDLEIEKTHGLSLRSGQGHMGVGDSAEEFISFHALGRERLLVLSCGLPTNPLIVLFFARWETIESFCLNFLHTSRQMRF